MPGSVFWYCGVVWRLALLLRLQLVTFFPFSSLVPCVVLCVCMTGLALEGKGAD
jgi:hypothetical protein